MLNSTIVNTWEEFHAGGAGTVLIAETDSVQDGVTEHVVCVRYKCPCCGREGALPIRPQITEYDSWEWDGNREAPTLSPSILSKREKGGCGWHGHLTAGVFVPC